mmetsp:Transcript_24260/g.37410  ORF Transcript_24260/g.37410 Transcript_24260/m.37410 type:complete len:90 (+) Transcript_24260:443-712(+)
MFKYKNTLYIIDQDSSESFFSGLAGKDGAPLDSDEFKYITVEELRKMERNYPQERRGDRETLRRLIDSNSQVPVPFNDVIPEPEEEQQQ